jgi:hypothetical protein
MNLLVLIIRQLDAGAGLICLDTSRRLHARLPVNASASPHGRNSSSYVAALRVKTRRVSQRSLPSGAT